ncbi:MAG: non-canonical purine NTP pyrophosphatase [Bdellovibrionota bacterium]|nr:non-canonical purine NTP pyrophosphatase [Bdellovibrionota bacterium]
MLELTLASGNSHKAEEFKKLFLSRESSLSVNKSPKQIDVAETGLTYAENAYLKAKAYYDAFKRPVMSDDSGLDVRELPGELGVHSARFGGDGLTDPDRVNLLLEKLKGFPEERREATFTCVLCFYLSPEETFFFEGKLKGKIIEFISGKKGFGYDPIFVPKDVKLDELKTQGIEIKGLREESLTLANIPSWKELHSHRAKAVNQAIKFFKERFAKR